MFSKKAMQHTRQAPGRDIHKHFSLAPARSHTITASSKASAIAATRNPPPHPDPYKTGPKLAKRRRGHHTCHSTLSLPPAHPPPRSPTPVLALPPQPPPPHSPTRPPHLKPRTGTDGEGRRDSARLCVAAVRRSELATARPPPRHQAPFKRSPHKRVSTPEAVQRAGRSKRKLRRHPSPRPRHSSPVRAAAVRGRPRS